MRFERYQRGIADSASLWLVNAVFATACLGCAVGSAQAGAVDANTAKGGQFFEKHIQPILKRRCYQCHSHKSGKARGGLVLDSRDGWAKGGSEGPAIVPGQPRKSLLLEAVRYKSYKMPPKQKLPDREIALLEKWIAMGAPDPRRSRKPTIDPKKLWALKPIRKPTVPTVKDAKWPRGSLDTFILAGLEKKRLKPAGDTDRYTLLRRVTLDLTGLPPTPQEIESFVNDRSDRAYEKVVDRLLASSGFGDHWARHWFDLSCYADLADITGNVVIRDAWRYRDYVIAAFNSDKPLDRFIHEQIAGDLLPYKSAVQRREQIIATGYLAIGPWTLQNYIKGQLDADVVDHQIDRIGRTFLAQTISCARCHDHKFDPIPTRDYYALAGIFHSTRTTSYDGPGVWSQITHVDLPKLDTDAVRAARRSQMLRDLKSQQQKLQIELISLLPRIPGASNANVLILAKGIAANEKGRKYKVSFEAGPTVWAAATQRTNAGDGLKIDLLRADGSPVAAFRHHPGAWSGAKDAQKLRKASFSYVGDGSGNVRLRITSATPGSGRFGGALDNLAVSAGGKVLFEEKFDRLKPGSITGRQAGTNLRVLARATVPRWTGAGINHSHAVDRGAGNFAVQFFGGNRVSLSSVKPATNAQKKALARALALEKQLQRLASRISEWNQRAAPEKALAVRDVARPSDCRIYRRGDFQSLGKTVPRGFLSAVTSSKRYGIPSGTSGRLQLAHWLTDSGNPLTSRVLVNRIWHHLFGKGLVRTVDYFGVHGEAPSHPELLDFLATRFRDVDRWSLKATVRRMVLSRTYRMASSHNTRAAAIDPDNRLLWRMPRRRLTAESIRDAMLSASGQLDPGRGGPSLGLELKGNIRGAGGNVNPPTWGNKIPNDIKNRRSVYLPLKRERPVGELEILSAFDFPHPSEMTGARANTTVATQALFLTNAPFVKRQARTLAERLAKEQPSDERARINRLYLLTASRPAAPDEIKTALAFLEQCTKDLARISARNKARTTAWAQLCHAMLGSNNFLFRE